VTFSPAEIVVPFVDCRKNTISHPLFIPQTQKSDRPAVKKSRTSELQKIHIDFVGCVEKWRRQFHEYLP
jgi:hypothetical protein